MINHTFKEQIFGAGLQGAGQGFGGAMGLMASNISGMVGLDGFCIVF